MVLPLIIAIVVVWALGGLLVLGVCRAATLGDEHLEAAEVALPSPRPAVAPVTRRTPLRSRPPSRVV